MYRSTVPGRSVHVTAVLIGPSATRHQACTMDDGILLLPINPFGTAVPFRGQTTWKLSRLSPKWDCSSKRVDRTVTGNVPHDYVYGIIQVRYTCTIFTAVRTAQQQARACWQIETEAQTPYHIRHVEIFFCTPHACFSKTNAAFFQDWTRSSPTTTHRAGGNCNLPNNT